MKKKEFLSIKNFRKKLAEEVPAVFLYNPSYLYPVTKASRGNENSIYDQSF